MTARTLGALALLALASAHCSQSAVRAQREASSLAAARAPASTAAEALDAGVRSTPVEASPPAPGALTVALAREDNTAPTLVDLPRRPAENVGSAGGGAGVVVERSVRGRGTSGSMAALGAPGGAAPAFGALRGGSVGSMAGLGAAGVGWGGGGTGEGTIGLGTIGHGAGRGTSSGFGRGAGYGLGAGPRLRGRDRGPIVRSAPPTVSGAMSPDVIRRVVQRNIGQLRYCHEQGLAANPELAGRVALQFVIRPDGTVAASTVRQHNLPLPSVAQCAANAVRRWRFPETSGGVVMVTYPVLFQLDGGPLPPPLPPSGPAPALGSAIPEQPPPPPPVRVLTAASVSDTDRRANYLEYLTRHAEERSQLDLAMDRRVRVRVVDAQGRGVQGAAVTVSQAGWQLEGQSHGDGVWDWFPSVDAAPQAGAVTVRAVALGQRVEASVPVPAQGDGEVTLRVNATREAPTLIDLGFVIDVTGSMEDELRYVNAEVADIVRRLSAASPNVVVRVSTTFYGDRGDPHLVRQIPFTRAIDGLATVMQGVRAEGGGDYPEDMNAGLEAALTGLRWSEGPSLKVLVLIADAPPQSYRDENFTWRSAMRAASQRGIRVLPVAASGADRTVEYLFRAMGAYTSTPYVYLTDDSGIGNAHLEADTDRVAVERFNDLLVRVLRADLAGEGMHEPIAANAPPSGPGA